MASSMIPRPARLLSPRRIPAHSHTLATSIQQPRPRSLLTLAIETSCDDTCVAVLQTFFSSSAPSAALLFNGRRTSDHRPFGGIVPKHAVEAHTSTLAPEIKAAILSLPPYRGSPATPADPSSNSNININSTPVVDSNGDLRQRPDFISVTRGPGMGASLAVGLNTAKGLAAAWNVPLVGVHHMQAHALAPRLANAMDRFRRCTDASSSSRSSSDSRPPALGAGLLSPDFPFSTLLVSGGHTALVHSASLVSHRIVADAESIAVGDALDKCARDILPADEIAKCPDTSYAAAMEEFAFPLSRQAAAYDYRYTPLWDRRAELEPIRPSVGGHEYDWYLTPALAETRKLSFNFSGLVGKVHDLVSRREAASSSSSSSGIPRHERRALAQCAMRAAFEHIVSRIVMVLQEAQPGSVYKEKRDIRNAKRAERDSTATPALPLIRTIVVAGGVACNKYLMHILRRTLDVRGFSHVRTVTPPQSLCTDNAAMVAWAATEMYEAGYQSDPSILVNPVWPLDPSVPNGGIIEAGGWTRQHSDGAATHTQ